MSLKIDQSGSYKDSEMKSLMDMYRQLVAQRYTPSGPEDIPRLLAAPPYQVSRKLDGELWFLVQDGIEPLLVAANGRILTGQIAILTAAKLPAGTCVAGELHGNFTSTRERVGDVQSAITSDPDSLQFTGFDVIRHDGMGWREMPYQKRLELLTSLLPGEGVVSSIPVRTVGTVEEVLALYSEVVDGLGAEGIIVRCSDGRALKVKPIKDLDLVVLGFTSRVGDAGLEARSLLVGVHEADARWVPLGTIGNMENGVDRSELFKQLKTLIIDSNYRKAASTGQLYQMVRPEIVIECRALDVQVEDSDGRPIKQPLVEVTNKLSTVIGQVSAATVINGVARRIRVDKGSPDEAASWRQIEPYVSISVENSGTPVKSEIIRRQVWTKASKGKVDVRKLIVWKTNKESIDPTFPVFVVQWTDYSPGRKTPLAREVRPVGTLDQANEIAQLMIDENIKKGWEEVTHGKKVL